MESDPTRHIDAHLTGAIEDMNTDQRLDRMIEISKKLIEVIKANSGSLAFDVAVEQVADDLGITRSQVHYGLGYAERTGVVSSSENGDVLSAA